MAKRVLVIARDLLFRSKLRGIVVNAGGEAAVDEAACDLAVVEIEAPQWEERIRGLAARGVPVLAFGSHVHADLLRLARDAGAEAIPNSQVVEALIRLLA
jgi:hypothetical protein